MSQSIIMVHGAFCGGWTFNVFRRPFEAAGLRVMAPDLRGHGLADPSEAVRGLSMLDYAADIAALAAEQATPPVLIGHSLGGLVCMLAARRAPAAAVILLAPSPPWGVSGWTMAEGMTALGLNLLGPYWTQAVPPDRSLMLRYSLDRMPPGARRPVLAAMRPESGRALWETLNWWLDPAMTTSLGVGDGGPALVLVGETDAVHPPATARAVAERIGAECEVMTGMSHWLPGEPGWQEVAGRCLSWLARLPDREVRPAP